MQNKNVNFWPIVHTEEGKWEGERGRGKGDGKEERRGLGEREEGDLRISFDSLKLLTDPS